MICPSAALLLGILVLVEAVRAESEWGYDAENGPATWSNSYPDCGGYYQSPVNINTDSAKYSNPLRPHWVDYEIVPNQMNITNNGHTLTLTSSGTHPQIYFDSDNVFELVGVHFHWGKNSKTGSEHTFDNYRYPIEMHAVHRKITQDGVLVDPPEIVVIAVVFTINEFTPNRGVERFIHYAPAVRQASTTVDIRPFAWSQLIPRFTDGYYYYKGSLTTPPCSEVVTFLLWDNTAVIQERAMEGFRLLQNSHGGSISGNYRPVQPLNGRPIYYVRR